MAEVGVLVTEVAGIGFPLAGIGAAGADVGHILV